MLFVYLFLWLCTLSVRERMIAQAVVLVDLALDWLATRPDTPALRHECQTMLQTAHASLDIGLWMTARDCAGLPWGRMRMTEIYDARDTPTRAVLIRRLLEFHRRVARMNLVATRWAERMSSDPLRLDAARRSFTALAAHPASSAGGGKKAALTALSVASTAHAGEVAVARLRATDGGRLSIRAPPQPDCRLPIADRPISAPSRLRPPAHA